MPFSASLENQVLPRIGSVAGSAAGADVRRRCRVKVLLRQTPTSKSADCTSIPRSFAFVFGRGTGLFASSFTQLLFCGAVLQDTRAPWWCFLSHVGGWAI